MNKKLVYFTLLFCFQLVVAFSAQIPFYREALMPVDEDLQKQIVEIKKVDEELEDTISDLRKKASSINATEEDRINFAAFLIKKILLQRNFKYEKVEELFIEASDMVIGNFALESLWGDFLYAEQDYDNCILHYENALNKQPDDINIIGLCGIAYLNTMNYEKAYRYIETFLSKYPDDYAFLFYAGRCCYELNKYEEAVAYFEKSLEYIPNKNIKEKQGIKEWLKRAKEARASTDGSSQDEDDHFVITFAGNSQDELGEFPMEALNEVFDEVANLVNLPDELKNNSRFNVIFFLTEDYYKQNINWSAASAQGIQIRVPLATGLRDDKEYVKGVLAHEFTHTMINLKAGESAKVPVWVHEGLAQYQEYRTTNGSEDTLRDDFQDVYEKDFKENDFFIPLDKISLYMSSSDRRDVSRAYVASWLAVRYLKDIGGGEEAFDTLLTSLRNGYGIREAVKEVTGDSYKDFQDDMKQWIQNQ